MLSNTTEEDQSDNELKQALSKFEVNDKSYEAEDVQIIQNMKYDADRVSTVKSNKIVENIEKKTQVQ